MSNSVHGGAPNSSGFGATEGEAVARMQDEADSTKLVDTRGLREAREACERRILAAINALERATGLEVSRVETIGQTTVGADTLTALVRVELVLR